MLQIKEKAAAVFGAAKQYAGMTVRFAKNHRVPTAVVGCLLVLSMLMSVITVSIHEVTVLEDGEQIHQFYAILTDRESLMEKAELTLGEHDELEVTETDGKVTISVLRAFPVSIEADGETVTLQMASGTVADALEKAGITVNESDAKSHLPTAVLRKDMQIRIYRVTADTVVKTQSIAYETEKIKTDDLYQGETEVVQKGEKGEKKLTYSVTYIDGKESERVLLSEEITKEPVTKIVKVGTKVKSTFKKTSSTPKTYKKVIAMTATAYSAGGYTASGLPAQWGVVAVDPRVIPLGTKVYVETADGKYIYGTAIAADTGGAIKGNKIDICVNTRAEAYAFGRRTVNVYIL
ncbi:MAG: G5 domain-containing protein [Clostridia bacterium]|nr:G5 domain-containing protein [Clostridia bacterium]